KKLPFKIPTRKERNDQPSRRGLARRSVNLHHLVRSAFEKKHRNRLSFLAGIAFGRVPVSPPIPVPGIGDIALDAMQPGMGPRPFGTRIVLGDLVSGLQFPAQSVPYGPE